MKEFRIAIGSSDRGGTIATFYELTYRDAIEAAIEILTLNNEATIAEIYPRIGWESFIILQWDSESKKVCPLYGETVIKELPDRQSVIDYCLKMKGKGPPFRSLQAYHYKNSKGEYI